MKKQLLKESEIRKMMKFANIGALSDGFVEKLEEGFESGELEEALEDDEDSPPVDDAAVGDDADMAAGDLEGDDADMAGGDLEGEMEDTPPAEGELPPEAVEKLEDMVASLKAVLELSGDVGEQLANALSTERTGDEPAGDVEADLAAADMDLEPEGGEAGPPPDLPGEEEQMVAEVMRRVAKRLRRMKRR